MTPESASRLETVLNDNIDALYDLLALQKVLSLALDEAQEQGSKYAPSKLEHNEARRVNDMARRRAEAILDELDESRFLLRESGGES